MSPEVKRTQEQWRVNWMGADKVSDVEIMVLRSDGSALKYPVTQSP